MAANKEALRDPELRVLPACDALLAALSRRQTKAPGEMELEKRVAEVRRAVAE